jgi:hypothetical protein
VVRSGEVERGAGGSFDLGVTVELGPVVEVAVMRADDRIHLPVTEFLSQLDGRGPFGDVPLAGQPAALLSTTVALAPLGRLSQEPKQRSSALFVPSDEAVDRLVADREPFLEAQPAADLFGAEALTQETYDELPVCRVSSLWLRPDCQRRRFASSCA